jgi:ribosome-associated protein
MIKTFDSKQKAKLITKACDAKKGLDIVCLDVQKISSVTDYVVIATGTSDRHVKALGEAVLDCLKEMGERAKHREGLEDGIWVLVDGQDVMVHIFQETSRTFYSLEELMSRAVKVRFR